MTVRLDLIQYKGLQRDLILYRRAQQTTLISRIHFDSWFIQIFEKLGYDNMSRDIQTCNERLDWTGLDWTGLAIFWYGFLFSLSSTSLKDFL